jgi:hypothetical protein
MRPVDFGEALSAGARLILFSDDKPDRFFTVVKFRMDATSGVALELKTGVPIYQVEDEEGRTHLLITCRSRNRMNTDGIFGGRIAQALILVSGPINDMAFAVAQLAVFRGASDEHI